MDKVNYDLIKKIRASRNIGYESGLPSDFTRNKRRDVTQNRRKTDRRASDNFYKAKGDCRLSGSALFVMSCVLIATTFTVALFIYALVS